MSAALDVPGLAPTAVDATDRYCRRTRAAVLALMFTDLENSTGLRERLGEHAYEQLREEHDAVLDRVIRAGEAGEVVSSTGDGVLAVFSEPSKAVERALSIQRELHGHSLLRVRIGIDMGQVFEESRGGVVVGVFGRHVNRASRIQTLAQPTHVLLSFQVYDCAVGWLRSPEVAWHNHGWARLKGVEVPVFVLEPFEAGLTRPQSFEAVDPSPTPRRRRLLAALARWRPRRRSSAPESASSLPPWPFDPISFPTAQVPGPSPAKSETTSMPYRSPGGLREVPPAELSDVLLESTVSPGAPARPGRSRGDRLREQSDETFGASDAELRWVSTRAFEPLPLLELLARRISALPQHRRGPILWVDDHMENNDALAFLLTEMGCEIHPARSTVEARTLLEGRSYRLVISDMGRGDDPDAGLEIVEMGRQRGVAVLIFASVQAVAEFGTRARELGAALCTSGAASLINGVYECLAREG